MHLEKSSKKSVKCISMLTTKQRLGEKAEQTLTAQIFFQRPLVYISLTNCDQSAIWKELWKNHLAVWASLSPDHPSDSPCYFRRRLRLYFTQRRLKEGGKVKEGNNKHHKPLEQSLRMWDEWVKCSFFVWYYVMRSVHVGRNQLLFQKYVWFTTQKSIGLRICQKNKPCLLQSCCKSQQGSFHKGNYVFQILECLDKREKRGIRLKEGGLNSFDQRSSCKGHVVWTCQTSFHIFDLMLGPRRLLSKALLSKYHR